MKGKELRCLLAAEIDKRGISLKEPKLPNNFVVEMSKRFSKTEAVITAAVRVIRKTRGIPSSYGKKEKKPLNITEASCKSLMHSTIYSMLVGWGLIRKQPGKEMKIASILIESLRMLRHTLLPSSEVVCLFLGTPTSHSAGDPNNKTFRGKIFDDNLCVARQLMKFGTVLEIAIGSAIDSAKATLKVFLWRLFVPETRVKVYTKYLDDNGYYICIKDFIRKHPRKTVIVVFMASGAWVGGNSSYPFSTNFKGKSERLVREHPHDLYIMAMVADTNMKFHVEYLGFPPTFCPVT